MKSKAIKLKIFPQKAGNDLVLCNTNLQQTFNHSSLRFIRYILGCTRIAVYPGCANALNYLESD